MKTLNSLIVITLLLTTLSATAKIKPTKHKRTTITLENRVSMNGIGNNGVELKFGTGENGFYIAWQTSHENNTKHFELQVTDGSKSFKTIKIIAANNATQWLTNYETTFIRNYISVEKVYYRLKTVFTNNTEVYTAAIFFKITSTDTLAYANVR